MRIGLIGTGYWADVTHALAMSESPDAEFVGIWGRRFEAAQRLAEKYAVTPFQEVEELFESVDAVGFAVPPDTQAQLAVRAAEAGKHLLLEKPIAFTTGEAERIVAAVEAGGVAALVFLTARFKPELDSWVRDTEGQRWLGARGDWLTAALSEEDSPWAPSTWRWERGALWDLGPHALSLILPIMGSVESVTAVAGGGDLLHAVLTHEGGGTTAASFSLRVPRAGRFEGLRVWNGESFAASPESATTSVEALERALSELRRLVDSGQREHRCDVRVGKEIVRVLELLEQSK